MPGVSALVMGKNQLTRVMAQFKDVFGLIHHAVEERLYAERMEVLISAVRNYYFYILAPLSEAHW